MDSINNIVGMDMERMIQVLDAYFENTPKEHFEEVWKDVKKYERYGLDVNEYFGMPASSQKKASFLKKASSVAL